MGHTAAHDSHTEFDNPASGQLCGFLFAHESLTVGPPLGALPMCNLYHDKSAIGNTDLTCLLRMPCRQVQCHNSIHIWSRTWDLQ